MTTPDQTELLDLLLACRVILAELVEAEPSPVHTSREQAILRRIEQVLERTKPVIASTVITTAVTAPPPDIAKAVLD